MATTKPAAKQPAKATTAQKFDPIAARDRIKAINELEKAHAEEKAALIAKLADEGFALIGEKQATIEDMSNPENWRRGDVVKCMSDEYLFLTEGGEYTLESDGVDKAGEIHTKDNDGDETWRYAKHFVFARRP